ncbi:MAG: nickel pincer cofactor biosynthesis protein LarC [Verrucomicrobiia bacterium]
MKTLYLDLCSGISGDMFLGAMLDLGVDNAELERQLRTLHVSGWHLHVARGTKQGIAGSKFEVHIAEPAAANHDHPHKQRVNAHSNADHLHPSASQHHDHAHPPSPHPNRNAREICELISSSPCSDWVKQRSISVFRRIAEAEGKIHGQQPDEVHFHEVGAVDSIIDIVGACVALELLGCPRVLASHATDGSGWVQCAHGRYPVPVPATIEILASRGIPLAQCDEPHELVTPTGAALLAEFAESFGPIPTMRVQRVGYGLGTRDLASRPNVLRAILGEIAAEQGRPQHDWETDTIAVLESNIDDATPEMLAHFAEQMFAAGALDVFFAPIQMKKGRPGVILGLICPANEADLFAERILRGTSAFGVRKTLCERRKLRREFRTVSTPFGEIKVKIGLLNGQVIRIAPEYESCREAAVRCAVPISEVYHEALRGAAFVQPCAK